MGYNDEMVKALLQELGALGVDSNATKVWTKQLDKVRKLRIKTEQRYEKAHNCLRQVADCVTNLERHLIEVTDWDKAKLQRLIVYRKELKKLQGAYIHELIVSKEDKEFHSTYATIMKLLGSFDGKTDKRLLLQSEVENLLALCNEDLNRPMLKGNALAYFYDKHSDKELVNLPPAERVRKICDVYQKDVVEPMLTALSFCRGSATEADVARLREMITNISE